MPTYAKPIYPAGNQSRTYLTFSSAFTDTHESARSTAIAADFLRMCTASSFSIKPPVRRILASHSIRAGTDNDDVGSGFLIQPVRRYWRRDVPRRGLDRSAALKYSADIEANAKSATGSDFVKLENSKFDCSRPACSGH